MALDPDRYRLSEAEHEAVFEEIKADIFSHAKTADQPVAVIFGGQPGSGKSAALSEAMDELRPRGGAAEIIGDDFRSYHPAFRQLMAQDDKTAAFYTDRDTGRWVEKAIAYAQQQRLNIVIEGTMRDSDKVAETMTSLRDAGYEIDARALAVNPKLSWQGVMQRYEKQKLDRGNGRMTAPDSHQAAYDGMPVTLERIEREKLADRVTLYRRGAEVVYANTLQDGRWVQPPEAAQALERERNRPMSVREAQDYAQGFDAISAQMKRPERQASGEELKVLEQLQAAAKRGLAAAVFREVAPVEGLKAHPELANAYAAMAAIEKRLEADGTRPAARSIVMDRARENIAQSIEQGANVALKAKVQQDRKSERDAER